MIASLEHLMATPGAILFGWALVHFLWQGLVIVGLLKVALIFTSGKNASLRYIFCGSALALMPICLIGTYLVLGGVHFQSVMSPAPVAPSAIGAAPIGTVPVPEVLPATDKVVTEPTPTPHASFDFDRYMPFIVAIWFVGVMLLAIRKAGGFWIIWRLRHRGIMVPSDALLEQFRQICRRLGVDPSRVCLRISTLVQVPLTMGWLKPIVLLPAVLLSGLTTEEIELILAHELAHVRRYDYLANLLQTIVETLFFYHPVTWWISRQMRQERENCCDDLIATHPAQVLVYAKVLARLETIRPAGSGLASAANGGNLLQRIQRLLGESSPTPAFGLPALAALLSILILIVAIPLAKAQISPTPAATMSEADAKQKGIAALVNGTPVYWWDILYDPVPELVLRTKYSGDDLKQKILMHRELVRDDYINRELVIQEAEAVGVNVQPELDKRLDYAVKGFHGDQKAFEQDLKKNGLSLEKFTQKNREDALFMALYMHKIVQPSAEYQKEHRVAVGTLPKDEVEKANRDLFTNQSIKLQDEWHASLKAKAVIQKFTIPTDIDTFGGVSDLSNAVVSGDLAKVTGLLQRGADINETDGGGNTALYYAVKHGNVEIATLLLEKGANVNLYNSTEMNVRSSFAVMADSLDPKQAQIDWGVSQDEATRRITVFKDLFAKYKLDPQYRGIVSQPVQATDIPKSKDPTLSKDLVAAVKKSDAAETERLLKLDADPNGPEYPNGENAFYASVIKNQVGQVKLLLQYGADPSLAYCGNKPIEVALNHGRPEMATVLHDAGAKISPTAWAGAIGDLPALKSLVAAGMLKKGHTDDAMKFAVSMGQLDAVKYLESVDGKPVAGKYLAQAATSGNVKMMDYILSQGANMKTDGVKAMDEAVCTYDQPEAVKFLLAHGADPNHFSNWNKDLLSSARSTAMVKILLDAGANPNVQGDYEVPLTFAPDAEAVRLLVQHGANLKPNMKDGYTLLESVVNRGLADKPGVIVELIKQGAEFDPQGNGARALSAAAQFNQVNTMKALMDHGVSPSAYVEDAYHRQTVLGNAAWEPSTEAVKLLLDRGANPSGDPRQEASPLEMAVIFGQAENAELLRKAGATGLGELSYAAALGDLAKVKDLLGHGANVNETDSSGNTPLFYATRRGHVEIAELLLTHGANQNLFNSVGMTPKGMIDLLEAMGNPPGKWQMDWGVSDTEGESRDAAFKKLFAKYPADPNYQDIRGRTVLHQAAYAGNDTVFLASKKYPQSINLPDHDGNTPLLLVALSPNAKFTDTRITVSDNDKANPKKTKEWNLQAYLADQLIKAGARPDLIVANGKTVGELALEAAKKANNPQLIFVLQDASAHPVRSETKTDNPTSTETR